MNEKIYNLIANFEPFDDKEKKDKEVMLNYIKNTEDVLTRNNEIVHMTVSAWITNKDKNKILMIYHNIYNSWAWVGGHADGDDELVNVARKEAEYFIEGLYFQNFPYIQGSFPHIKEDD